MINDPYNFACFSTFISLFYRMLSNLAASQQFACFSTRFYRFYIDHDLIRKRSLCIYSHLRVRSRVKEVLYIPGSKESLLASDSASNSLSRRSLSLIARSDSDNHFYRVSNAVLARVRRRRGGGEMCPSCRSRLCLEESLPLSLSLFLFGKRKETTKERT